LDEAGVSGCNGENREAWGTKTKGELSCHS